MNIYEHGIVREQLDEGSRLKLLATDELPLHFGFTLTMFDLDGRSLVEQADKVMHVTKAHAVADYYEESDLRYCLRGMLHHLNHLLELYAGISRRFGSMQHAVTEGNTSEPRVFHEVDAFLGAAKRIYETIRKVLWKHYGVGKKRWGTIFESVNPPSLVPPSYIDELKESFVDFGSTLAAYRNCIMHGDPLTDGGTSCRTQWYEGRWGVIVKLPENPKAMKRADFRFENGPDALKYCHEIACKMIDLCLSLTNLPSIRHHLDHPEEGDTWVQSLARTAFQGRQGNLGA